MLMQCVCSEMGVMEGTPGTMILTMRLDLLRHETYRRAGQFVRWSLLQGGPGIPVLWNTHYVLCSGHELPKDINLCDEIDAVPDHATQAILREVTR